MALTLSSISGALDDGFRRKRQLTVTFDSSYLTGGEVLEAKKAGFAYFDDVILNSPAKGSRTFDVTLSADGATATIKVLELSTGAETSGGTDLSALSIKVTCSGAS